MRTHYFDDPRADEGDHVLRDEVDRGTVPSTCLLGGHLVAAYRINGEDPCQECRGPRERCGGRQAAARGKDDQDEEASIVAARALSSESSASRRDRRRMTIEQLWRLAHDAIKHGA